MGLFNRSKYTDIEKALREQWSQVLSMMSGMSSAQAKEAAGKMLDQLIEESKKEGTYCLPQNLGDIILGDAGTDKPALKNVAEIIRKSLPKKKAEGVKEEDVRFWWNLNDIERRTIVKQSELAKMTRMIDMLDHSNESSQEKAIDKAATQVRKFHPIYGDPDGATHTTGDDSPLPYELTGRIDAYIGNRLREDPLNFKREMEQSSTFNALIRKEIKAGNL